MVSPKTKNKQLFLKLSWEPYRSISIAVYQVYKSANTTEDIGLNIASFYSQEN